MPVAMCLVRLHHHPGWWVPRWGGGSRGLSAWVGQPVTDPGPLPPGQVLCTPTQTDNATVRCQKYKLQAERSLYCVRTLEECVSDYLSTRSTIFGIGNTCTWYKNVNSTKGYYSVTSISSTCVLVTPFPHGKPLLPVLRSTFQKHSICI